MPAKPIMIQGTASSVGKSVLTAGLCRVLYKKGYKVAPFKSQNMALNSYITAEGGEMGRAQVVQAEAAGIDPHVMMNPILLKPSTDKKAQVIVNGKVLDNMSAADYHAYKPQLAAQVKRIYQNLATDYDYIILEGAGSPAEINLREGDLVNMGMAEMADAPVLLVGDIDRGGVFASLYGTLLLVTPEERARIRGVIINKFRGDVEILKPGLEMFETLAGIPVLGVLPYADINIEDEDSLAERFKAQYSAQADITICVLYLPHVSNFTDFNVFETQDDVQLRYVMRGQSIPDCDVIIIPGSKNTIEDMAYLHRAGLAEQILRHQRRGGFVVGICGGYQMLGSCIADPHGTESAIKEINGLGLLPVQTVFEPTKTTTQVSGTIGQLHGQLAALSGHRVTGYEIHMGQTQLSDQCQPLLTIEYELGKLTARTDGAINQQGTVFGSYLHGIFDDIAFLRSFINAIRASKGLTAQGSAVDSFRQYKEQAYDQLAQLLEDHLDVTAIMEIIEQWPR